MILGSASKWRQAILHGAGFSFSVMHANIDEKAIRDDDPKELVLKIAHAKADAILKKLTDEDKLKEKLLITSDQVVYCAGEIFEKPASEKEIRYFIQQYQQHPAATYTAIVLVDLKTGKRVDGVDVVNIAFNHIPDHVIDHVIAEGEVFQCAGGFQIEDEKGELNPYIKGIDGDLDSVKGFPIKLFLCILPDDMLKTLEANRLS